MNRKAAAFTLVELLVVVAVICILAALLLPSLGRGKAAAYRVRCVGNLHQFGLATQMYWDENAGRCFRYGGMPQNNGAMTGRLYWFGWLQDGAEGQRAFDPTQAALYPQLRGRGVEICPSLNYLSGQFKLKATGAAYGYGYNLLLSAPTTSPPINVNRILQPSTTVLLTDSAQINTFLPPASPSNPMLEEFFYVSTNRNEATAHFRHQATANVLFGDSHVGREKPDPGSLDSRLTNVNVGRLRPEILVVP